MSQERGRVRNSLPLAVRSFWQAVALDSCPAGATRGRGVGVLSSGRLLLLAWLWGAVFAASTWAAGPSIADVSIGLGGKFKVGHWTPVRITIQGGDADFTGQVELLLPDSDDVSTRFVQESPATVQIPPGGQWTGWRYMKLGKIRGAVQVVLRGADGTVASERVVDDASPEPSTWQWVVTVGPDVGVDQASVFPGPRPR